MENIKLKLSIYILFIVTVLAINKVNAQNEYINCRLVLKGSTDTLNKTIIIKRTGSNNKGMAFKDVLGNKLAFKMSNGETEKISIKEVDRLEFIDFHEIRRVFIDEPQVGLNDDKDNLIEEIHTGTISFYRRYKVYQPGLSTGATYVSGDELTGLIEDKYKPASMGGVFTVNIMGYDFFIYDGYPPEYINLNNIMGREKLLELTEDMPILNSRIMEMKNYKDLVEILKDYDTDPEIVRQKMIANSESIKAEILKDFTTVHIDSLNTKPISSTDELKTGDYIKYIGPGKDKVGLVSRIISSKSLMMKYDLNTDPKEFQVRISDVELIVE